MEAATPHGRPAWSRTAVIGDYDGATDKENSKTEGTDPYAAILYRELRDNLRGSAYTKETGTFVHVENLAIARFFGSGLMRGADRLRNNSLPGTSDEKLMYWVKVLDIPVRLNDSRASLRQQCASHYKLLVGPTQAAVDAACSELLGDLFVRTYYQSGSSLSDAPVPTFWPGENPGPLAYDLGEGTWLSSRAFLIVEVKPPDAIDLVDFHDLVDTQLFRLLNRVLPIYMTFDWSCNHDTGFQLDVDELDYGALG